MSAKALDRAPGQDWIVIVRKNGTHEFVTAFVAQPLLYASVLNAPCIGVERIAAFFAATSGMYDTIAFTHETKDDSKTFLEWEGKVFGEDVAGTTILTRDQAGLIASVQAACVHGLADLFGIAASIALDESEMVVSPSALHTGNQRVAAIPNFRAYMTATRAGAHSRGS
jgi:hypothetical protein